MTTITLNAVPNRQVPHLMAILGNLSFIPEGTISVRSRKSEILEDLEQAAEDIRAHINGKIKLKSAWDMVNEL